MRYLNTIRNLLAWSKRLPLAAYAAMALTLAAHALVSAPAAIAAQQPKNIIIMFADGAASTQWDFGKYSSQILRQQPFVTTDVVFKQGVLGLLSTAPSDAYIADSAAAGSALSTGFKVNNGAVAVTPDGKAVPTAMEIAKSKGKRIGLVTTATVYDATPAAFSVHARSRRDSQNLVDQYLALAPDVLMGLFAEDDMDFEIEDLTTLSSKNRFYAGEAQLKMLGHITMSLNMVKEKLGKQPTADTLDKLLLQHFPGFHLDADLRELLLGQKTRERNFSYLPQNVLGRMVARQTSYYWGTSGHTPQPVPVGAIGPGAELFRGYQDNTDFGKHLHRLILGN